VNLYVPLTPFGSATARRRRPLGWPNYRRRSANYRRLRSDASMGVKCGAVRKLGPQFTPSPVRILPPACITYAKQYHVYTPIKQVFIPVSLAN